MKTLNFAKRAGIVFVTALLAGNLPLLWLSCVKHSGDDDLDIAIMRDSHTYMVDERHSRGSLGSLSDWHNGKRKYDWWTRKNTASNKLIFIYHYWNPCWGTNEGVYIYVNKEKARPWRKGGTLFNPHPLKDYPITFIGNVGGGHGERYLEDWVR